MPSVSVLPTFVSKDTDLKADLTNKELSATLTDNKGANFSRLVAEHQVAKNKDHQYKGSQGKEPAALDKKTAAIDGDDITVSGKTELDEPNVDELSTEELNASQETDDNKLLIASEEDNKLNAGNNVNTTSNTHNVDKQELLAESEKFMSLLYQSDKTLSVDAAKTSKDTLNTHSEQTVNAATLDSKQKIEQTVTPVLLNTETEKTKVTNEQKLTVFAKDERLAGQALKDYQLSLQSSQGAINNASLTSEQLTTAPLNSKVTDVAASVSLASKGQLSENVDAGLYQRPVEPIGKTSLTAGELLNGVTKTELATTKEPSAKIVAAINETNINKVSESIKAEASTELDSIQLSKEQLSKINLDKLIAERNPPVLPQTQQAQLQKDQTLQGQTQQNILSPSTEEHVPDSHSEEFIDAKLLAGDKPSVQQVKTVAPVVDNITMRSASELQAQAIQSTQAKQNNEAYFAHQANEVLNHNIASDTAHIQKNNSQLQQETISIFRKDFAEAVKEKVLVTINQKLQRFDITLDPPEFGNMQVRVNLQGEQASVNFIVQNQQAKEALEQNMHKLRDMLSEQGVDVGGANVEQQSQQQNNDEQNLTSSQGNSSALSNDSDNTEHNVEHILSTSLFNSSATGVDYYA